MPDRKDSKISSRVYLIAVGNANSLANLGVFDPS
jgi:hypothetical protein